MKKIAFIWYWDMASQIFDGWRDGLKAALEIVAEKHDLNWYLDKGVPRPEDNFDFILLWSDSHCPFIDELHKFWGRKGLCYGSTFEPDYENLKKFDVVFVENEPMYQKIRSQGIRAIRAFGTDTDFFSPDVTPKTIPYFFPGTFSPWKDQKSIAHLGPDLTCVGYLQPDGYEELQECVKHGVKVVPENVSAQLIKNYYKQAEKVIIPSLYGSERTVLEAMSMNLWPEVLKPEINQNAYSFVEEYLVAKGKDKTLTPRQFILKNYSHQKYAEQLLKGIEEC